MEQDKKDYPIWKIILQIMLALALAFVLLLGVPFLLLMLWARNMDAKYEKMEPQVQELAVAYIAEQYPGNDFEITNLYHNFKDNSFDVKLQSRSSADTYFTIKFNDTTLEVDHDSYEFDVANRGNTVARVIEDYQGQARKVLETLPGVYRITTDFMKHSENSSVGFYFSPMGLDNSTLVLDGVYDAAEMGWDHGYLELTFVESEENIHIRRIMERLLEVDAAMTQAGVGYRVVEIALRAENHEGYGYDLCVYGILREDLTSEDLLTRLQEMWEEQEAHRQALKEQWNQSEE